MMWILKKEKIKLVDDTGKKVISFQLTWVLTLYVVLIIASKGAFIPYNFNILRAFPVLLTDFSIIGKIIIALYLYNLVLILFNMSRSQRRLKNKYILAIPFLK